MVNEQRSLLMVAATYVVKAQRRNNGDEVDTESHSFCGVVEINGGGVVLLRLHPGYGVKGPSPTSGPQGPRQNGHQDPTRIGPVCVRRSASRGFLKTPNKKCDPGPISLSRTLGRLMDASRVQSNHLDSISEMNALSQTSILAGTVFRCLNLKCAFRHPPLDGLLGSPAANSAGSSLPLSHPRVTPSTPAIPSKTSKPLERRPSSSESFRGWRFGQAKRWFIRDNNSDDDFRELDLQQAELVVDQYPRSRLFSLRFESKKRMQLGRRCLSRPNWQLRFCEEWDTGLKDYVLRYFVYPSCQSSPSMLVTFNGRGPEGVEHMICVGVCSVFAKILKESPMKVQATVAQAVSELAGKQQR
ncbi:hypothetical protein ACFX2J_040214 [Malus domestica]